MVGNLGKDPALTYTQSGSAVCKFSLATTDQWTDESGQRHQKTEWHNIVVWKKQAENASKYLAKGSPVYLEGKIRHQSWDGQDGTKRYSTEIHADEIKFLGGTRREESPPPDRISGGSRGSGRNLRIEGEFGNQDFPSDIPF
ncbi:MAG TPA: single-stranded DNA-binding protein [Oligoflexus sp.]|uniref:single-stranded DNA-binding protein n=1 Tax=Oligoflexus sp. TaxID=1971216 RepID=UPI002D5E0129|nr:single-stranded DNA-binding protein [Oligoflexus sp.]HYX36847.1 single-stranded DNA-binding protein [Oligoflexus sp.]